MEYTKHKLPKKQRQFFHKLSDYLDTKLHFYGSVQRDDFVSGRSDIDTAIFCDNEESMMTRLQHFLQVPKKSFKKVVWKLYIKKNRVVYGHKVQYENTDIGLRAEFSIFNEKFRDDILKEHLGKIVLPFYCTWFLHVLKFLFYTLGILPRKWYSYLKSKTLSRGLGRPDDLYLVLDKN